MPQLAEIPTIEERETALKEIQEGVLEYLSDTGGSGNLYEIAEGVARKLGTIASDAMIAVARLNGNQLRVSRQDNDVFLTEQL